ncbi:MAG TPA: hypothetical protein VFK04_15860 [Gemmatimonadaceae bacterium]|nr:hypothetical protein [Gemmatimonadaceae bacterium]
MTRFVVCALTLLGSMSAATRASAQESARMPRPEPILRARALGPTASVKIFDPAGSVRVVAWDHDSIVVRGRVPPAERFFFAGSARGVKLGVEDRVDGKDSAPCDLVIYLPRHSQLSVKTASASITGTDVSGWFYSVSGTIHLSGVATSIEAETMGGDLVLDVNSPWVRARTGDGRLLVRGTPQDADASTIAGTLDIATSTIQRGRFASVTGDIRYRGAPAVGGIFEFSNHSGGVDILLPREAGGVLDLSTVVGQIENGYTQLRPVADVNGRGRSLHLELERDGGHITVRTFRGTIRLRRG